MLSLGLLVLSPRLSGLLLLDLLVAAVVLYGLLRLVRGTRASQMLLGLVLLAALYFAAERLGLAESHWLAAAAPYLALGLVIIFQPEIRQGLTKLGGSALFARLAGARRRGDSYEDVVLAARHLSAHGVGALMVLARKTGLRSYSESGIALDARLSYDLLLTIFRPGGPLHDGAVIVQGQRLAAAACFLPLATDPGLSSQLGTRHRAALGISEETDAVAVVVSETSGEITIALDGRLSPPLSPEDLRERLGQIFHELPPLPPGPEAASAAASSTPSTPSASSPGAPTLTPRP